MNVQIIEKNGCPEWAVIPYEDYQSLVELADLATAMPAREQVRIPAETSRELMSEEARARLLAGEAPVKVWREVRGLSPETLAELAGVTPSFIAILETGRPTSRIDKLKRIASALDIHLEDLIKD